MMVFGDARANWRAFAESIEDEFQNDQNPEFGAAVNYILENPPKKQIVGRDGLEWSDSVPQTAFLADKVLVYVRRIRNNLFHGGKFNGHWFAPERSTLLLGYALTILNRCRGFSHSVGAAFDPQ
jgi:hypothetical protein